MIRKSNAIVLGILASVAAIGAGTCCCVNWYEDREKKDGVGQGRVGRTHHSRRWWGVPIFIGGGGGWSGGGGGRATGTSGTSNSGRGGFGATGGSHGGGVGA